jgi:hypothetical protein
MEEVQKKLADAQKQLEEERKKAEEEKKRLEAEARKKEEELRQKQLDDNQKRIDQLAKQLEEQKKSADESARKKEKEFEDAMKKLENQYQAMLDDRKRRDETDQKRKDEAAQRQMEQLKDEMHRQRDLLAAKERKEQEDRRRTEAEKDRQHLAEMADLKQQIDSLQSALKKAEQAPPRVVMAPAPPPPHEAEEAPEVAGLGSPSLSGKGGFFIYIDVDKGSETLDALRQHGFEFAVADADGFVSHMVEMDGNNNFLRFREFDREDRNRFADVMFRIRDTRNIPGLGSIETQMRRQFQRTTIKLLISRSVFNQVVMPMVREAQGFSGRYRLGFDGIRLAVPLTRDSIDWAGIYFNGKFYKK